MKRVISDKRTALEVAVILVAGMIISVVTLILSEPMVSRVILEIGNR
jgi:hypothetical protein